MLVGAGSVEVLFGCLTAGLGRQQTAEDGHKPPDVALGEKAGGREQFRDATYPRTYGGTGAAHGLHQCAGQALQVRRLDVDVSLVEEAEHFVVGHGSVDEELAVEV